MAKKTKGNRVQVILECTEKNKKNTPERLERMKYNPYLKKVTLHREIK